MASKGQKLRSYSAESKQTMLKEYFNEPKGHAYRRFSDGELARNPQKGDFVQQ